MDLNNQSITKKQCPVCSRTDFKPLLSKKLNFQIYVCSKCRLGQTVPYPEESNGQENFSDSKQHYEDHYINDKVKWRKFMAKMLDHAVSYVKIGQLLDVGTGVGFMLEVAQERGFVATGIEPSKGAVQYAKEVLGLNVVRGHFPAPELEKQYYDVITLSHVLEHVPEPINFLRLIKQQLKPGGVVVITAPNYRGLIVQFIGKRWYGFQPTQHIWQLTPHTVKLVAEKAGLKVVKKTSESMDYTPIKSFKSLIYFALATLGAYFKSGDQLVVVAKNE